MPAGQLTPVQAGSLAVARPSVAAAPLEKLLSPPGRFLWDRRSLGAPQLLWHLPQEVHPLLLLPQLMACDRELVNPFLGTAVRPIFPFFSSKKSLCPCSHRYCPELSWTQQQKHAPCLYLMVSASASPARQLVQKYPLQLTEWPFNSFAINTCSSWSALSSISKAASIRPVLQSFIITILILSYVKVIATE